MCNCRSFRENCVTHARTHAHGANYNLPPASRAGDNKAKTQNQLFYDPGLTHKGGPWGKTDRLFRLSTYGFLLPPSTFYGSKCNT